MKYDKSGRNNDAWNNTVSTGMMSPLPNLPETRRGNGRRVENMSKKGFTLIELLVVIAIIAILAAILFPVFVSAKDKAKTATCTSNLKQLGMAMGNYVEDNSGRFPPCYTDGGGQWWAPLHWVSPRWSLLCKKYITNNLKVQTCPSVKLERASASYGLNLIVPTYASNANLFGVTWDFWGLGKALKTDPPTQAMVAQPSKTIAILDARPGMVFIFSPARTEISHVDRWLYGPVDRWGTTGVDTACHNGGHNFVFADGHVKWFAVGTREIDTDEWWDLK